MRIAIVGGGIAGVSTASALRALGFDGPVTLIDSGDFPYDRPPLTKDYLAGVSDAKQVALQAPEWYDQQRVGLLTRTRVTRLRPAEGGVELGDGRLLLADRVVLATGGSAARPRNPGFDAPHVHTLRTIEDADRLRAALCPGARVLVIGAGLIGAELASTAAGLGCEVTLVDPVAPPLTDAVGAELAGWLHEQHAARGITTLRCGVTELRGRDAVLSGGHPPLIADVVVAGVGMVPETTLARDAGLRTDREILVDAAMVTSNPSIFAAGDSARTPHGRAGHWEAAQTDGERVAASLLGRAAPQVRAPWFWTDRNGVHVEVVGRMAESDRTVLRGSFDDPAFAVFGLRGTRVVAAASVNDSNAVRAARRLIDRGTDVDPVHLADRSASLRRLLRG